MKPYQITRRTITVFSGQLAEIPADAPAGLRTWTCHCFFVPGGKASALRPRIKQTHIDVTEFDDGARGSMAATFGWSARSTISAWHSAGSRTRLLWRAPLRAERASLHGYSLLKVVQKQIGPTGATNTDRASFITLCGRASC